MQRVFVIAPTAQDIQSAKEHGDFVYLFDRLPPPFSPTFALDSWQKMKDNDFDPDNDILLMAGPQVATAQWLAAVVSQYTWCRALLFDATSHKYVSRTMGFEQDPDSIESKEDGQRRRDTAPVQLASPPV